MRSKERESFRSCVAPHRYPPLVLCMCQHSLSSSAPLLSISQLSLFTLSHALTNPHAFSPSSVSSKADMLKYQPTPLAICVTPEFKPVSKVTSLLTPWASRVRVSLPVGRQDSINSSPVHCDSTVSAFIKLS